MNLHLIDAKLIEQRKTRKDLAKRLNISTPLLSMKMSETSPLKHNDIVSIAEYLELSNDDILNIFFNR